MSTDGRIRGRILRLTGRHLAGIGAAAVTVALISFGPMEAMESLALDRFFEIRGARPPTAPIVIVSIDESSVTELKKQWPFPRALHGEVIRALASARPIAIGIDLVFDQPSFLGPADDEALGEAVALAGNVVLAAAPSTDVQATYTRVGLNLPLRAIKRGAAVGVVGAVTDTDGHVRRTPLRFQMGRLALPNFDVELYRVVRAAGLPAAPLPAVDDVLVNFRGPPRTFPWVSYYRVVNGEVPPGYFRGKIVLIGATSQMMHDEFPTVFARGGAGMPGVEIHANALETLLRGNRVREVPPTASTALAVIAALVGSWLVGRLNALRALAVVALLYVAASALTYVLLVGGNLWIRHLSITLGLLVGYGVAVVRVASASAGRAVVKGEGSPR